MKPLIYQVIAKEDYTVFVFFDDGRIKRYDGKPLIEKGGVFTALKDIDFFKNRCTIMNHTLAWDVSGSRDETNCIDICPDTIYETCPDVNRNEVA